MTINEFHYLIGLFLTLISTTKVFCKVYTTCRGLRNVVVMELDVTLKIRHK